MKRTKSKSGRKIKKNKTRVKKQTLRGGCGCGTTMIGGSAGLAELPIRYYYGLKDEAQNPAYMMKGGRSKKRRMRGGMPSFLLGQASNPVTGYGEVSGLLPRVSGSAGDVTVQPIMNGSGKFYA
jgi:hypothetical protein